MIRICTSRLAVTGVVCLILLFWMFLSLPTKEIIGVKYMKPPYIANSRPANVALSSSSRLSCKPVHHIAFLKVPKAGSTTMENIFYRFGLRQNLMFILPSKTSVLGYNHKGINEKFMLPTVEGKPFDILCNHAMYNRQSFMSYLHDDSVFVGIIREPFSHFVSSLYYLGLPSGIKPKGVQDRVTTCLTPRCFDRKTDRYPFYNPILDYFGLERKEFENSTEINKMIGQIDKDFRLILILEKFDESLVLMRRYFCWPLGNIIYIVSNVNMVKPTKTYSDEVKMRHSNISLADYALYRHFSKKLDNLISEEGLDFHEEVEHFQSILIRVNAYCNAGTSDAHKFERARWHDGISITKHDCQFLLKFEDDFLDYMRIWQYGDNWKKYVM